MDDINVFHNVLSSLSYTLNLFISGFLVGVYIAKRKITKLADRLAEKEVEKR